MKTTNIKRKGDKQAIKDQFTSIALTFYISRFH